MKMENTEIIAEIYLGYEPGDSYKGFEHPGTFFVGVMLDGEKIYNSQSRATKSGLHDRISDVIGHLRSHLEETNVSEHFIKHIRNNLKKYKCLECVIWNGYKIEDGGIRTNKGKIVECDSIPVDPDYSFRFSEKVEEQWAVVFSRLLTQ